MKETKGRQKADKRQIECTVSALLSAMPSVSIALNNATAVTLYTKTVNL
jgi:hypothetical protein